MIDRRDSKQAMTPSALERHAKSVYWSIVRECLVTFHHFSRKDASSHVGAFKKRIADPLQRMMKDLIYHDEPFYVACDVAGIHEPTKQSELLEQNWESYKRIRNREE